MLRSCGDVRAWIKIIRAGKKYTSSTTMHHLLNSGPILIFKTIFWLITFVKTLFFFVVCLVWVVFFSLFVPGEWLDIGSGISDCHLIYWCVDIWHIWHASFQQRQTLSVTLHDCVAAANQGKVLMCRNTWTVLTSPLKKQNIVATSNPFKIKHIHIISTK